MAVIKSWTKRDGSFDYVRTGDSKTMWRIGGAATSSVGTPGAGLVTWPGLVILRVPLVAAAGNGGMIGQANPEGVECVIHRLLLRITTVGGAVTGDFGVGATSTTSSDVLLDGVSLNTTGVFDNVENQGTNGTSAQVWGITQFVTGTASGAPTGLVAYVDIHYTVT